MQPDPGLKVGDESGLFLVAEPKNSNANVGYLGNRFTRYAGHVWSCSSKLTILTNESQRPSIEKIAEAHNLKLRLRSENEPLLV